MIRQDTHPPSIRHALSLVGLALFCLPAALSPAGAAEPPGDLFGAAEPLPVRIRAPWRDLLRNDDEKPWPATLSWTDAQGRAQSVPLSVERRGITRQRVCGFPPIRLRFEEDAAEGTVFQGQGGIKMVTHCNSGDRYRQYYVLELLAYRVYNLITDYSFRVRALWVHYDDVERGDADEREFAFLIEDDDDVAARHGMDQLDIEKTAPRRLDPLEASRFALFQLLIGNLDWSPLRGPEDECCHNAKLIGLDPDSGPLIAVPYDFDSSGLVDAHYALPPDGLRLRSVTTRLYRGYCVHNETLPEARRQILGLRPQIDALFENQPLLNDRRRREALEYLADYFSVLESDQRFDAEVTSKCRG